jgi:hypothetical protein
MGIIIWSAARGSCASIRRSGGFQAGYTLLLSQIPRRN